MYIRIKDKDSDERLLQKYKTICKASGCTFYNYSTYSEEEALRRMRIAMSNGYHYIRKDIGYGRLAIFATGKGEQLQLNNITIGDI